MAKFRLSLTMKRLGVLAEPLKNLGKAKLVPLHRAVNELVSGRSFDFDVEAVAAQEDIGGSEGNALVAIEEAVVVAERLHERACLFFK